jgi:hypothetical protein
VGVVVTARVPKVGEKGWKYDAYTYSEVEIVAVRRDRDQVWVRRPTDALGHILYITQLVPPEPTPEENRS